MRAPDFWQRARRSPWPFLLLPLSRLWRLAFALRQRRARPLRLGVPVICVGNLVVGGAGKTPTVLALAKRLQAQGVAVHVISRGYGGRKKGPLLVDPARHAASEVGDEALLLGRSAPTWIGRRRQSAAQAAVAAGAAALLLDDGYQDPALVKDLSLVVVDADYGFGNGRVLPAGPLREPVESGLARADAVLLIGAAATAAAEIMPDRRRSPVPLLRAEIRAEPIAPPLQGAGVIAFAGIGRPEKFFATLTAQGCRLLATHAFPDHHAYRPAEIRRLVTQARDAGARLLTTQKDQVRLGPDAPAEVEALAVTLHFADEAALERLLAPLLARILHAGT